MREQAAATAAADASGSSEGAWFDAVAAAVCERPRSPSWADRACAGPLLGSPPLYRQWAPGDCGLACLSMALAMRGIDVSPAELRARRGRDLGSASLGELQRLARLYGLESRGLRVHPEYVGRLAPGSILHWDGDHFVVLHGSRGGNTRILDPLGGAYVLDDVQATSRFWGTVLEFPPIDPRTRPVCPGTATLVRRLGNLVAGPSRPVRAALGLLLIAGPMLAAAPLLVDDAVGRGPALAVMCVAAGVLLHSWAALAWAHQHAHVPEALGKLLRAAVGRQLYRSSDLHLERAIHAFETVASAAQELGRGVGQLAISSSIAVAAAAAAFGATAALSPPVALFLVLWAVPTALLAVRAARPAVSQQAAQRARAGAATERALVARVHAVVESGQTDAAERAWLALAHGPSGAPNPSWAQYLRASMTVLAAFPCLTALALSGEPLGLTEVIAAGVGTLALHHVSQLAQLCGLLSWVEMHRESVRSFLCDADANATACPGLPVGSGFYLDLPGADQMLVSLWLEPGALIVVHGEAADLRDFVRQIGWPRAAAGPRLRLPDSERHGVMSAANGWVRSLNPDTPLLIDPDDPLRLARALDPAGRVPPNPDAILRAAVASLEGSVGLLILGGELVPSRTLEAQLVATARQRGACVMITRAHEAGLDEADAIVEATQAGCVVRRIQGRVQAARPPDTIGAPAPVRARNGGSCD